MCSSGDRLGNRWKVAGRYPDILEALELAFEAGFCRGGEMLGKLVHENARYSMSSPLLSSFCIAQCITSGENLQVKGLDNVLSSENPI
jgi:hypothetical protein